MMHGQKNIKLINVNVALTLSPGPRSWKQDIFIKNGVVITPFYGTHKTSHLRTWASLLWRSVSAFGIVNRYWSNGSRIESHWGRDYSCRPHRSRGHLVSCRMCTGSYPGVKRPERGCDHLSPSAGLRMVRSYTSTSPLCLRKHVTGRPLPLLSWY